MLMSKNVNNDVSKDSPIELASKENEKYVTLGPVEYSSDTGREGV